MKKQETKKRGPYKKKKKDIVLSDPPKIIECLVYYVEEFNDSNKIVFLDLSGNIRVIHQKANPFPILIINKHPQITGNENRMISQMLMHEKGNNITVEEL